VKREYEVLSHYQALDSQRGELKSSDQTLSKP
jgi:hypothetical protein